MRRNGGIFALTATVVAIWAMASGCGSGGNGQEATAAGESAVQAKRSPAQAARQLARALTEAKSAKDCEPLSEINARSRYTFGCPQLPKTRRSMRRFEVVGAETYGTGAVVDYKSGELTDGASIVMHLGPDREWGVTRFALLYDPSAGTSDADSRDGFDRVLDSYLRGVRERDCRRFLDHAVTDSTNDRKYCANDFQRTKPLAQALRRNPGARPRYLGGNERFGFYGLTLKRPKPSYATVSVIRMAAGTLPGFLVLNFTEGPLPRRGD